ncbi:glycosyl transferase [Caldimicrobium thiodismutans]|uniref:Glycosyl transferase n=2 Tax=Caldimicrobium thiodismutans TaxID=1653476 RepID=A0A0U5BXV5_9BACT|nr:glycosyl transferase [Caldimicrobium thiodismutans]
MGHGLMVGGDKVERLKIVFSSNTSFSLYNFRLGLMRRLKNLGYEVIAIAPKDEYTDELLKEGFKYFEVKNLSRKGKNPFNDLKLLWEYIRLFKKIKPDLVINYTIKPNIYGGLAGKILGIPYINVVTGLGYVFVRGGALAKLVKFLYWLSFRGSNFVVFQNTEDRKELKGVIPENKVAEILGSGVNTEYFSPSQCKETEKDRFIFLFVGRFLRDKGILELVSAGKLLYQKRKDFEIWLLGGLDKGNPESISNDELEKIEKLPFIQVLPFARDVRLFLCNCDCMVLPSYREGLPKSLLEAMAMGKTVITTDAPGCREVCLNGVNGFLVKPKDIESLYRAMLEMLELSQEERLKMGKEGKRLVEERFSEEIVIEKYLSLIKKIL